MLKKQSNLKKQIALTKAQTLYKIKMASVLKKATDKELDILAIVVEQEYIRRNKKNKKAKEKTK